MADNPTFLGMDQATLIGYVRHFITVAGTGIVAKGLVSGGQWDAIATDVAGLIVIAGSAAWSAYNERKHKAAVATALVTPVPPTSPGVPQ